MHLSIPRFSRKADRSHPRKERGFTLVEVSLSMGVVSFGLLGLLSLLTLAMDGVRSSTSDLVGSQIASGLMGELQSIPWSEVADRNGKFSFYDASGQKTSTGAAEPAGAISSTASSGGKGSFSTYTAMLEVASPRPFGCDVSIFVTATPGDAGRKKIEDFRDRKTGGREVAVFTSQLVRLEK